MKLTTPKQDDYFFPAEWHTHEGTWLTFPHNEETWPADILNDVIPTYCRFIDIISQNELVKIIANNHQHELHIKTLLNKNRVDSSKVLIYPLGSNDSWCRDHGPSFVINEDTRQKRIVDWQYNAWGGKYPPFDLDNAIPSKVAEIMNLTPYPTEVIMEGGSIEVNSVGDLITTESCLLNTNRNPRLSKEEIEQTLKFYYNVQNVHWLKSGIVGDDTDGHIDDITRFVDDKTIITMVETNRDDENYVVLKENLEILNNIKLVHNATPNVISIPMPEPLNYKGERLPASYANFYIANHTVVVPIFRCSEDEYALGILKELFPNREVIGLDSRYIVWGLGSFHCLSQQEPKV